MKNQTIKRILFPLMPMLLLLMPTYTYLTTHSDVGWLGDVVLVSDT